MPLIGFAASVCVLEEGAPTSRPFCFPRFFFFFFNARFFPVFFFYSWDSDFCSRSFFCLSSFLTLELPMPFHPFPFFYWSSKKKKTPVRAGCISSRYQAPQMTSNLTCIALVLCRCRDSICAGIMRDLKHSRAINLRITRKNLTDLVEAAGILFTVFKVVIS
jgi:hypothetical protein